MKLSELALGFEVLNYVDTDVTGLCYDSRLVKKGELFFCIEGFERDGHDYAKGAVERGASALMVSRPLDIDVAQIVVLDGRLAMAALSDRFYGYPSREVKVAGVTGTNGKTTTTYMIKAIAEEAGLKAGLIGTIVNMVGSEELMAERTTPESPDLFRLLRRMVNEGCGLIAMEVSSHSLDLKRVGGVDFDVGAFTNLTQDHLDFHLTFENYREAKKELMRVSKADVVNIDDPNGAYMTEGVELPVITYGFNEKALVRAKNVELSSVGTRFTLSAQGFEREVRLNIPGNFSVYNALCSASAGLALGFSPDVIVRGLERVKNVPGRFEVLTKDEPYTVILDYSHTPDSLKNALLTINGFKKGRLICVFGCGGDRDRTKRPVMGEISGRLADLSVITSDNPRTEEPHAIIDQIVQGIKPTGGRYTVIENRREAMEFAIKSAGPGDVVLLAGKGHETYQEINHVKHDFDEKAITAEIIKGLAK